MISACDYLIPSLISVFFITVSFNSFLLYTSLKILYSISGQFSRKPPLCLLKHSSEWRRETDWLCQRLCGKTDIYATVRLFLGPQNTIMPGILTRKFDMAIQYFFYNRHEAKLIDTGKKVIDHFLGQGRRGRGSFQVFRLTLHFCPNPEVLKLFFSNFLFKY